MSADEETTGPPPRDAAADAPTEASTEKPAAAKKAAAKKPAARKKAAAEQKPAAEEKPAAEQEPADGEQEEAEQPAAKKAARKRVKKTPAPKAPAAAEKAADVEAKPARGGTRRPKAPRRKVVRARARYVRTSARKARMVCGALRGKTIGEARAILAFTPREVARDWSKLLESAVANAESNHELLEDDLIVREAYADEGPTIKRFRPRAMGRATPIRKRTSHLTITLTPGPEPGTTNRHG